MKKTTTILLMTLIVQAVFALGLMAHSSSEMEGKNTSQPALKLDVDSLTLLEFDSKAGKTVISKVEGEWKLPELDALPADPVKVGALLTNLESLKVHWPAATDEASHKRYQVSAEDYQTKLTLKGRDGEETVCYLGKSPGFRKVYFRAQDSPEVYSVELSTMDFTGKTNTWLNKRLLAMADLKQIKTPSVALSQSGGKWALSGDEEVELEPSKIQPFIASMQNLSILDVSDKSLSSKALSVELKGGDKMKSYRVEQIDGQYLIEDKELGQVFTITKALFEQMTQTKPEDLKLTQKAPNPSPSPQKG